MKRLAMLSACVGLAACSGGGATTDPTPSAARPGSIVKNADGSYTVTAADGTQTQLSAMGYWLNGNRAWATSTKRGILFQGRDASVVVGYVGANQLAVIDGTKTVPTRTGASVDTTVQYNVTTPTVMVAAKMTLTINFDAGTVAGGSAEVAGIDGRISGSSITGDFQYKGDTALIEGGFYGVDEIAGIAKGGTFVAGFHGTY